MKKPNFRTSWVKGSAATPLSRTSDEKSISRIENLRWLFLNIIATVFPQAMPIGFPQALRRAVRESVLVAARTKICDDPSADVLMFLSERISVYFWVRPCGWHFRGRLFDAPITGPPDSGSLMESVAGKKRCVVESRGWGSPIELGSSRTDFVGSH